MASDKLTWTFELLDKMSGPARRIANALRGLTFEKIGQSIGKFVSEVKSIPTALSLVAGFVVNEFRPLGRAIAFAFEPVTNLARRAFAGIVARAAPIAAAVAARFQPISGWIGAQLGGIGTSISARLSPVASAITARLAPIGAAVRGVLGSVAERLRPVEAAVRGMFSRVADWLKPIGARIASTFSAIGARLKPVGVELAKLLGKAMTPVGSALKGVLGKIVGGIGPMLAKVAPVAAKGLLAVGGAIASMGLAAATAVGAMALAGGKFVGHALVFKEDSLAAFEAILGSKGEAEKVMSMAIKFAATTPFKTSEVVGMAQQLLAQGFKANELEKLMMGVGDVGALLGADKMDSVIRAFGRMRNSGKLTGESLMMLTEAGVNQKMVLDALGKALGKTNAEVEDLLSAGKITDAQGIEAALAAITKGLSGGTAGGAMEKKSQTLSGLFSTLASIPEELVFGANMSGAMAPLKAFVTELTAAMSPDSANGKRVIAMLELIGRTAAEIFKGFGGGNLEGTIGSILNVVEPLVAAFASFGKGVFAGLGDVFGPILEQFKKMGPGEIEALTEALGKFGRALGVALGAAVALIAAMSALSMGIVAVFGEILDFLGSVFSGDFGAQIAAWFDSINWAELGGDVVRGLISGITSMMAPLTNSISGIANAMKSAFTGEMEMQSPSKVFERYGVFTGQGFINGLSASGMGDALTQAIKSVGFLPNAFAPGSFLAPAAKAAAGAAAGIQPAAASGGGLAGAAAAVAGAVVNLTVPAGAVIVNVASGEDPASAGKAAADSFMGQLGAALKGIAGEMGR